MTNLRPCDFHATLVRSMEVPRLQVRRRRIAYVTAP